MSQLLRLSPKQSWIEDCLLGFGIYYITTLLVVIGLFLGKDFIKPNEQSLAPKDLIECFFQFDAKAYRNIAVGGYTYDPATPSRVAFFPAYPCIARLLADLCDCSIESSLLLTSHSFLLFSFILLARYCRLYMIDGSNKTVSFVLLAFGVYPPTFFLRMAYTEAMLICLLILCLLGMAERWPNWVLAILIGLATATRSVGIALLLPFTFHLWRQSVSWLSFSWRIVILGILSCWGLIAYMVYLWWTFDSPLAFAHTQDFWRHYPHVSLMTKLRDLLILEPIWGVYVPSSPRYWTRWDSHTNPIFSLFWLNPLFFLFAVGMVFLGWWKKYLNTIEVLLSVGLLAIPYCTRAHEMSMAAHARFTTVAIPMYFVVGRWLAVNPLLATFVSAISVLFLTVLSALFAAKYFLF